MEKPKRLTNEVWLQRRREPYRLKCPSCRSTNWTRHGEEPRLVKVDQQNRQKYKKPNKDEPWEGHYWCKHCDTISEGVLDAKLDEIVCMEQDFLTQEIDNYDSKVQKAPRFQRVRSDS